MYNDRFKSHLPTKLYKVKVPLIATYSEEEIELFGIPQHEVEGKPKDAAETMTTVMINLDKMIDIYSMGYQILLHNNSDTNEIFNSLERYLKGTIDEENFSLNRATVKDERMDEIDKFAQEMFGINKVTIVSKNVDANNGFGFGLKMMHEGFVQNTNNQPILKGKATGILAAYNSQEEVMPSQQVSQSRVYDNTFSQSPTLNIDKVKRKSPMQRRRGTTMQDLMK